MAVSDALRDARARTLALVGDLADAQWMGPRLAIVNPLLWEVGHVAWFAEHWVLRRARGGKPLRADGDALWDSARVHHDTRWDLPLPDRAATLAYAGDVLDRILAKDDDDAYFATLSVFHEDMHDEAFTYTRQTLAYPAPRILVEPAPIAGPLPGDVAVPGARTLLGAIPGREPFVFDNEKWAHPVDVAAFRIARAPVTNAEYARFVEEGGPMPVYWRRGPHGFEVRRFDRWDPLPPHQPIVHVSWNEADAFCRWAGRRLPTEAEWELAASAPDKRRFPWGDDAPTPARANLDGRFGGPIDVGALPESDSAYGCRQMIGNVWEWTSTRFAPYPGFVLDPYKEYSAPWFETPHMVLRGGCWATRARLIRNTWRNFYPPHRRDVLAGFRTCALA